ncbi:unnamed protein product [Adineta ricciae]|uniref:G-protein coupled receptors family 1 profile domain-containing protein n=1 Tax=Adineta ricciae TaxID=249248 RepID=A0A814I827_ADIRI|nr:unnamed protein product [Adineta ricciae]CAF1272108.1 unnamed protein product [Adineta ricciae]
MSNLAQNSSFNDKLMFENVQIIFGIYLIPIICIPGLICNILCIIVFITHTMQRLLTTQFLLYLTISDTIKLSNDLLYSFVLIIQIFDQQLGKKLFLILYRYCHYINTVSTLSTAWLTLIVAIERYILCTTNSQRRIRIQKNSRLICNLIIFVSLLVALPVSFRYEIVPISSNDTTTSSESIQLTHFGSSRSFRLYSIVIDLIRAIFPSLLLFYLNTRIIYLLVRMKSSTGTAFSRLTLSLIVIIGCFICSYFPDALLSLVLDMGYINETYRRRTIREITDFCVTLNSATNFAIYFSISYTFRRAVFRLFQRQSRKTYYPTTYEDLIHRHQYQARSLCKHGTPL